MLYILCLACKLLYKVYLVKIPARVIKSHTLATFIEGANTSMDGLVSFTEDNLETIQISDVQIKEGKWWKVHASNQARNSCEKQISARVCDNKPTVSIDKVSK